MATPPDFLTQEEQRQLDKIVDVQIEDWQDSKFIHEEERWHEQERLDILRQDL